ncbi:MAG: SH3 domain-containing protein [Bacilli bacterium]|nr:SH3 domain-containing protein [Bacilli bacterium]
MKKIVVVVVLIAIGGLLLKTYVNGQKGIAKMANIEKGWHVEISNSYINIRKEPSAYSVLLGKVEKDEKYEVLDINLENGRYIWYQIKIDKDNSGWVASGRSDPYLIDHNNPNDIATPVLKFSEEVCYANSIDDINYEHLEVWDDRDEFEITHKVYKEIKNEGGHQYWIVYKVEDGVGKTTSKTQKIVFVNEPKDSEVLDFNDSK